MHTLKLKQVFTILLIFLFYFYGIWLPQGKAENVSRAKDWEQVPVNNKETQSPSIEHSGTQLPTLDETPSPDIVEGENLQKNPSVNEDSQNLVAEEEISSAGSPTTISNPSLGEEAPLIEEEKRDQTPVVDNRQQENAPDEIKTSSPEEEKSLISHQLNTDEKESQDIKKEDFPSHLPEHFPATVYEKEALSELGIKGSEISEEIPPQEPVKEITALETQFPSIEQSGKQLSTLDETPSPDIVDGENLKKNPSVNEDGQNLVAEEKTPSAGSPITISNPSPGEEAPLIEEEKRDQTSVVDNRQQESGAPDEEKASSPEEEKSLISHQLNTDERESQDIKKEDFPSHLPEHFPATVHEKEAFSDFGIKGSKISEETPPVNEDKQGIIADKDMLLDVKEKESHSIISTTAPSVRSPGKGKSLVKDEKDTQSSKVLDEQQGIISDEEGISILQEEKSPIDYQPIGKEATYPQEPVKEIIERGDTKSTWKIWHADPTHGIILAVVITLIAAKIGGWIAKMISLPEVVGKLILGMILGNIYLLTGTDYFDFLKTMPFLKMLSYFGTLLLLLTAGLHTDLRALLRVGASSFLVCLGGIAASAGLGIIVSYFLIPDISNSAMVLLAIVLCNSSTGLLCAVLNELKAMNTLEGRVIVGATILTDIIVILAFGIASGIVIKGGVSLLSISVSFGIALFILITAVIIILKHGEKFGNFLTNRLTEGLNIPIIVILSLLMAFMFGSIGLHTVIGAFIAGLFLRNVKLRDSDDREYRNVESFIRPFYALLVPILFLRVGALVDLKIFSNSDAILLGLAITGAAVAGKLFCSVCPVEKGINRLFVGIGMATKLEGTLILAGIGRDIGIFNDTIFSSLIMAIVFTSTICPFLMKILLLRKNNIRYENICIDSGKKLVKVLV